MVEVEITVKARAGQQQIDKTAKIKLDSLVPVYPKSKKLTAKSKEAGRWTSESDFLEERSGTYYVKNLDLDPEESWAADHTEMEMAHGFFFDSKTDRPFLVLQNFQPMKIPSQPSIYGHGNGRLLMAKMTVTYPDVIPWRAAEVKTK